mgnify:CR=1 FL=1
MGEVTIGIDRDSEMFFVSVGDEVVSGGNFWDFNFPADLKEILEKAGVEVSTEEYVYDK